VVDEQTRAVKYASFLAAWSEDTPAVVLYSPYYTYAVSARVSGISSQNLIEPSDRFYGVERWTVNRVQTARTK
jgi:hypothetical protein